mgnify:CR=1 FL=1
MKFKTYNETQIIKFTKSEFLELKNKMVEIYFKEINRNPITGKITRLGFSSNPKNPLPFDLTLESQENLETFEIGVQRIKKIKFL